MSLYPLDERFLLHLGKLFELMRIELNQGKCGSM